jgi:hypothetical protein
VLLEHAAGCRRRSSAYERLLARWPDLPDSWYNLAVLQRKLRASTPRSPRTSRRSTGA